MMFQYSDGNLTHQVLNLYILPRHDLNLRDKPWRCKYFGVELEFVAGTFLLKYP